MKTILASATLALLIALPMASSALVAPANNVTIVGFLFVAPATATFAGGSVTWTSLDPFPHTVTANDGSFDSPTLRSGQSFTVTFQGTGTVTYFCKFHPWMVGAVAVA